MSLIDKKYIESDIFKAFCNIMSDLRDGFLYELGATKLGIQGHIDNYVKIIEFTNPAILNIMNECDLNH